MPATSLSLSGRLNFDSSDGIGQFGLTVREVKTTMYLRGTNRNKPACQDTVPARSRKRTRRNVLWRRSVILTIWREDIEHFGLLQSGRLVFDASGNEKRVPRFCFDSPTGVLKDKVSTDDVDHLLVRVTVASSDPALPHAVADEHHAWAIAHHLPAKASLGVAHRFIV